mgnify:CR=1 FL=1
MKILKKGARESKLTIPEVKVSRMLVNAVDLDYNQMAGKIKVKAMCQKLKRK